MERPAFVSPFLYRPMVVAVLGAASGIILFSILKGTGVIVALCLLSIWGMWSWQLDLLAQRTFALAALFILLRCLLLPEGAPPDWFMRPFEAARNALVSTTLHLFEEPDGSLLCTMLWGLRSNLDKALYAAYKGAGVAHILSLSGLHVTFIVLIINRLAGKAPIGLRLIVNSALLLSYCAIAAFPASLVRSMLMCLCPLVAEALGRKKDQPSNIAFAALCIIAFSPSALYDIGFQLSFGAVAAIAMLYRPVAEALPLPTRLSGDISMSICGMLGTLPLTAYHFKEVSLISIFANLLILPIVPFAFLLPMAACILGVIYIRLGEFIAPTARLLVRGMNAGTEAVAALPFSLLTTPKPPILSCFLFFGALFIVSRYCLLPKREKHFVGAALFAAALLVML